MKDAVVTVRLPRATRQRLEALARQEGRSLSQQVERLIERGLGDPVPPRTGARRAGPRALAGRFRGGRVPSLLEFRRLRRELSASLGARVARRDHPGR